MKKFKKVVKDQYHSFSRPIQIGIQAWLYVVLALIMMYVVYAWFQLIASTVMHDSWRLTGSIYAPLLAGLGIIALLYVYLVPIMLWYKYPRAQSNLKNKRFWLETIGWLIAVKAFLLLLANITSNHVNTSNQNAIDHIFYSGSVNRLYIILTAILMAPIIEEFIFRWLPFRMIKAPWLAFILGALGFTMAHSPSTFVAFLVYLSMAVALEISFYRNGFWASFLLHFGINFTAALTMLSTLTSIH